MKIDIITLTGITATDGSIIASGATIKFTSEFRIGSTEVLCLPKVFRNRELFEGGFGNVETSVIPDYIELVIPEEEFYTITPQKLYEYVRDELNSHVKEYWFEIEITGV